MFFLPLWRTLSFLTRFSLKCAIIFHSFSSKQQEKQTPTQFEPFSDLSETKKTCWLVKKRPKKSQTCSSRQINQTEICILHFGAKEQKREEREKNFRTLRWHYRIVFWSRNRPETEKRPKNWLRGLFFRPFFPLDKAAHLLSYSALSAENTREQHHQ